MVTVKKENRVLQIDSTSKDIYLADGYDVVELVDGHYSVIEPATSGRTYSVAEYTALQKENAELKSNSKYAEELDTLKAELDTLKKENAELKSNSKYAEELDTLKAELDTLKKENAELKKEIKAANKKEKGE